MNMQRIIPVFLFLVFLVGIPLAFCQQGSVTGAVLDTSGASRLATSWTGGRPDFELALPVVSFFS